MVLTEYEPAAHDVQFATLIAPTTSDTFPAVQLTHVFDDALPTTVL